MGDIFETNAERDSDDADANADAMNVSTGSRS